MTMTDPYSSPKHPTDPGEPTHSVGSPVTPPPPLVEGYDALGLPSVNSRHDGAPEVRPMSPDLTRDAHPGAENGAPGGARERANEMAGVAKEEAASVVDTAKNESADVAHSAKDAAGSVLEAEKAMVHDTAAEATDRAKETFADAKTQVKDLWAQSRAEISDGAGVQLRRLCVGARAVSDELATMAAAPDEPGVASDLARRASGYLSTASEWLEDRKPDEVIADVSRFARRSPGTFVAIALGLGVVAGRVARGLKDGSSEEPRSSDTAEDPVAAKPEHTGYDATFGDNDVDARAPGDHDQAPRHTATSPSDPATGYIQPGTIPLGGGGLR